MRIYTTCLAVIFCASSLSCSGVWSQAEKKAAVPVAVLPATMRKGFYDDPQKLSMTAAGTTGLVSGLAGGLIGGVVAGAVVAGLQNDYENDHEAQFNELESRVMAVAMGQEMQAALTRELETMPFYQGQISSSAGTQFKSEIIALTFDRLSGDSPDHAIRCYVRFTCISAKGQKLFSKVYSSVGYGLKPSPAQAPVASYVRDPELFKRHFAMIAADLSAQCGEALRGKVGVK